MNIIFLFVSSRGISSLDAFAMRPRKQTPLRKVKEEDMTSVALESSTVTTEYNGWTNRETWVVNLWLTNNESYYDTLQSIIKLNEADEQSAELERWVRDDLDWLDIEASMWTDLLTTSLGRVSWCEIIEANRE